LSGTGGVSALTVRQIEAIRAVMAAGGITRAAEVLDVSQPSVSRIVAELESSIGVRLFERAGRRLTPTEEGEALYAEVERTFLGLGHIEAAARNLKAHERGALNLVLPPHLVALVTEAFLVDLSKQHPDVSLSVEVQTTRRALERSIVEQGDIGITFEALDDPRVSSVSLGHVEAVCLLASDHRLARRRRAVEATELRDERLVAYMPDAPFRRSLEQVLRAAGVAAHYVAEARTTEAVGQLAAGLGAIAVIQKHGIHPFVSDRLVALPFRPAISTEIILAWRRPRPTSRAASGFLDHVDRMTRRNAGLGFTARWTGAKRVGKAEAPDRSRRRARGRR
jgi:DNA-binding transcriptional LysR family regulator